MERNTDMMDRDGQGRARTGMDWGRWLVAGRAAVGWLVALAALVAVFCWPAGLAWLVWGWTAGLAALVCCWVAAACWAVGCDRREVEVCGRRMKGLGLGWFSGPCEGVALGCEAGVFRRVVGPIWLRTAGFCRNEPRMFLDEEGDGGTDDGGMDEGGELKAEERQGEGMDGGGEMRAEVMMAQGALAGAWQTPTAADVWAENGRLLRRLRATEDALSSAADRHGCVERAWREERRVFGEALGQALGLALHHGASREDARFRMGAELLGLDGDTGKEG